MYISLLKKKSRGIVYTHEANPTAEKQPRQLKKILWTDIRLWALSIYLFRLYLFNQKHRSSPQMASLASCSSCAITGGNSSDNRWSMASLRSALPPLSLRFPKKAAAFQPKPNPNTNSKLLLRSFTGLAPLQPFLFPNSSPGSFQSYTFL
jgi:hypothetical protein